jgi:hypothetical protein
MGYTHNSAIRKNEILSFFRYIDETGDHNVKRSKPGSERQKSHVVFHMWKPDYLYVYIYRTCFQ